VVSMRLGLDHVDGPADVADALGIALCHAQHCSMAAVGTQP
jgi:Holliday junction resolvasome RuvABC endonuclease subunit